MTYFMDSIQFRIFLFFISVLLIKGTKKDPCTVMPFIQFYDMKYNISFKEFFIYEDVYKRQPFTSREK